jgi:beta-glucosidase
MFPSKFIKISMAAGCASLALTLFGCSQGGQESSSLVWQDTNLAPSLRAEALLQAMTLEQKQQQLVGNVPEIVPELPNCFGARHVRGIAELGIPTLRITNGPVGIGQNDCVDAKQVNENSPLWAAYTHPSSAKATALPSAMAVAASFDTKMAELFGEVIADEANALALHVFEAPGINLARNPVLGRNFEYNGEDPFLAGTIATAQIKKIQSEGVIAMAKHYAANEQETNRMNIAQTIDRQVLHELYLLPFEMTVKDGDVASLMCSYNDVNGHQMCENAELLTEVLRDQWGFEGYVQSDFFAVKSTAKSMKAGLDHLMPQPLYWSPEKLNEAIQKGELAESDLDLALKRRYTQMFKMGIFEKEIVQTPMDIKGGGQKARVIGQNSVVLLQNNGALPFNDRVSSVIVVGKATQVYAQQAVAGGVMVGKPMGAGGGSSDVVPHYTVSPTEGIQNVLKELGNTDASVELILIDDNNGNLADYADRIRSAEAVIIMAGTIAEEGADRATFEDQRGLGRASAIGDNLDWYTDHPNQITSLTRTDEKPLNPEKNSGTLDMIEQIMAMSEEMSAKTALVMKNNAGVSLPNSKNVLGQKGPAIVEAWFPGQEDGHIVADVLWGKVNPGAKAPVSYPIAGLGFLDHIKEDPRYFPGVEINGKGAVEYLEGLNIGYRWYDANVSGNCAITEDGHNPCLAFPFGHGLSYTHFELSNAEFNSADGKIEASITVTNTGGRAGSEVVQVYVGVPSEGQPPKRLVGFQKVELDAGAEQRVTISIDPAASNHPLSVYDVETKNWVTPKGEYTFYIGNSSSDAQLAKATYSVE